MIHQFQRKNFGIAPFTKGKSAKVYVTIFLTVMNCRFQMTALYLVHGMKPITCALIAPDTPSGEPNYKRKHHIHFKSESGQLLLAAFSCGIAESNALCPICCSLKCAYSSCRNGLFCSFLKNCLCYSQITKTLASDVTGRVGRFDRRKWSVAHPKEER